jgi:putative ABC transport system permease protein
MQTLKQTLRTLWRDRGFSAIAVAMLALGIGASTAIFSAVNVVLLQSSYEDADRLYVLEQVVPDLADRYPTGELPVNARHFAEWRNPCTVCSRLGLAAGGGGSNLTGDGVPERIRTLGVTHDLLPTLGVTPALGRTISPEDDEPGAPRSSC